MKQLMVSIPYIGKGGARAEEDMENGHYVSIPYIGKGELSWEGKYDHFLHLFQYLI